MSGGGSFESLIYDTGAYCTDLRQSTAPIKRMLDPSFANNCTACRPADVGYIGRQGTSVTSGIPLIDVDSDLKLLNYRATRDPMKKFRPCCPYCKKVNEGYPCGGGVVTCDECRSKMYHFPACSISTDYSRVTNPPCNLKGTGINRFIPLCLNPQDLNRWEHPGEVGINNRMIVLDNHVPCIPTPNNENTEVLPPQQEGGNSDIHLGCQHPCDFTCNKYTVGNPFYHSYYRGPMGGCPDITYQ